jgi:FkbM family methyltransferase
MKYDFIEIGTSDFDTLLEKSTEATIGASVEPLSYYLNKLPNKKNIKKINAAISNYNGECKIYYCKEENIIKYNLPFWIRGCNSINNFHQSVLNVLNERNLDPNKIITIETVPVYNIEKLYELLEVESINYLKIDCEGHDYVIINNLLDFYDLNKRENILPSIIEFEFNILTSQENKEQIMNRLKLYNYQVYNNNILDTMIVKKQ